MGAAPITPQLTTRPAAAAPQQESSMLTYEGTQIQGQAAIINHYANPASPKPPAAAPRRRARRPLTPRRAPQEGGGSIARFQTRSQVTTVDAQPIPQSSGLMVYTTGKKMVRHSPHVPARPA